MKEATWGDRLYKVQRNERYILKLNRVSERVERWKEIYARTLSQDARSVMLFWQHKRTGIAHEHIVYQTRAWRSEQNRVIRSAN